MLLCREGGFYSAGVDISVGWKSAVSLRVLVGKDFCEQY